MRTIKVKYKKKNNITLVQKLGISFYALYALFLILNSVLYTTYTVHAQIPTQEDNHEVKVNLQEEILRKPIKIEKVEVDFNSSDYETKVSMIKERLEYNKVSKSDIKTFLDIFHLESCRNIEAQDCFNTQKTPPTMVFHCQKPDGSYEAIEIINKGGLNVQAHCSDYGWVRTGSEQSIGLAQILVTTWQGYKCDGAIRDYDWKQQVDCAVKIKNTSGFSAWSTYYLLDN